MSGGVDSAVCAALLVKAGFDVTGVYMKNWADNFGVSSRCPWEADVEDVKKVAEHLGIPWKVYNFEKEYKERILDYFFAEYKAGRTPNPDILCNNLIKFDLFAGRAFQDGASYIATGHYARRQSTDGFSWESTGELQLRTAIDGNKDQGYFLHRLSLQQLQRAIFPLGNFYKPEIRILAREFNLPNAEKKDSQGICFIGDIDVRDFIREHLQTNPGIVVDVDSGKVIGKHEGLWFYTIGQRHGIGISSAEEPYFVVGKKNESNELLVGMGHEHPLLRTEKVNVTNLHHIGSEFDDGQEVLVSLRYREKPLEAVLQITDPNNAVLVSQYSKKFWAPAAGQGALLYRKENLDIFLQTAETLSKKPSGADLYKYFTGGETRDGIRNIQILGGGTII